MNGSWIFLQNLQSSWIHTWQKEVKLSHHYEVYTFLLIGIQLDWIFFYLYYIFFLCRFLYKFKCISIFILKLSYPIEKLFLFPAGFKLYLTISIWRWHTKQLNHSTKVFRLDNSIFTENWNIFEIYFSVSKIGNYKKNYLTSESDVLDINEVRL